MNNEEVPYPELAVVSPLNLFLVVDSTVKHKSMFGVTHYLKYDIDNTLKGYDVNVYTDRGITHYFFTDLTSESSSIDEPEEHYFKDVPLIEYKNNKKLKGDFRSNNFNRCL